MVVIISDADKARLCIGAWLQDTALTAFAAALSPPTISFIFAKDASLY